MNFMTVAPHTAGKMPKENGNAAHIDACKQNEGGL